MLEGLDAVPWARLTCTSGTADAVPGWLHSLASPSAKMRAAALWRLGDAFVHQGTVWTAAVAAVPFFIELLRSPEVGSKDAILDLLSDIFDGGYSGFDAENRRVDTSLAGEPEPQRPAIRAGTLVYLALIDDHDPGVRIVAAKLLAQCRSADFDPRPALDAAYAREADNGARAGLLLVRAGIQPDRAATIAFLADAMRSVGTAEERVVAASKLVEVSQGHINEGDIEVDGDSPTGAIPDDALAVLIGALTQPSRRVEKAYELAARSGSLTWNIGWALNELPAERLRFAVPQLINCLPRIGRNRAGIAARLLLRALFTPTDGKMLAAHTLSAEQSDALDALFEAELLWRDRLIWLTNLCDYGLPESRPLLADYLGRSLPPRDQLGAIAQPQPHRPAPFTLKSYEARIRDIYGYLHLRRKKGYRFERRADADFYSPNGIYLFYFPRTVDAVLEMEREVALLRSLPRLPLMRWNPSDSSRDTRAIGRAFIGGIRESGAPLTRDVLEGLRETKRYQQFATLLGRYLHALHAVPLDTLRVSLPTLHTRSMWEQLYAEVRTRIFDVIAADQRQRIANRIEPFLVDDHNWIWTPTLIHGAFTSSRILYWPSGGSDAALASVVGFRHAGLGDPAYDLATLLGPEGYGEEYVRRFEGAYPDLGEELERARHYAALLALRSALAAMDSNDRDAFDRAIAASLA